MKAFRMMKDTAIIYLGALTILMNTIACQNNFKQEAIAGINKAESDFCIMADTEGMAKAFIAFADTEAVIIRSDSLVKGWGSISDYYQNRTPRKDEKLTWKPDCTDASASGDLGYTFGVYHYSFTDSTGRTVNRKGIFHTVWKRNKKGQWKFVWD